MGKTARVRIPQLSIYFLHAGVGVEGSLLLFGVENLLETTLYY